MVFLVDNGSVRANAYKNLRRIAGKISSQIDETVLPAPLLHANKIPPEALEGYSPIILEDLLTKHYDQGEREFTILPLFFGPSGALVDYLPRRLKKVSLNRSGYKVRICDPLFVSVTNGGQALAEILEDRIQAKVRENNLSTYHAVLVDHGSPTPNVTVVRNELARILNEKFKDNGTAVAAASMERRKGPEFAFNEPLLETILEQEPFSRGDTVVAQLFLSPGRHAGPEGDIATICREAEKLNANLKTYRTELIGSHPKLIQLLQQRWEERELSAYVNY
ncbi:MAG: cobalamin biosynthesis protein CbiX [Verrucomicrobia bacterium]|nr:cobalamin biosynthesis protein CbiX [Verrucomicrobiota bacterium]